MSIVASTTGMSIPSLATSVSTMTSSSIPDMSTFPTSTTVSHLSTAPSYPIIFLSPTPPSPPMPDSEAQAAMYAISSTEAVSSVASWPSMSELHCHELRPVDLFGPRPDHVVWPKEHAPAGSRYCEEVDAYVPAHLPYRIRGLHRRNPGWWAKLKWRVKYGFPYENLVMAMGISHGELDLIDLKEAQKRPDIVYRSVTLLERKQVDPVFRVVSKPE